MIGRFGPKVVVLESITAGFGLEVIEFGLIVVVVCLFGDLVEEDCVEDGFTAVVVVGVVISITIGGEVVVVILCVVVGIGVVVVVVAIGLIVVVVVVVGLRVVVVVVDVVVVGLGVVVVVVVVVVGLRVVVVVVVVVVVDVVDVEELNKLVTKGTSFSEISDSEVCSLTAMGLCEEDSNVFWPSSPASSWLSVELYSKSIKDGSGVLDQLGA